MGSSRTLPGVLKLFLVSLCATCCLADNFTLDDRGSNAANVLQAGIEACNAANGNTFAANIVPYMASQNSYMSSAMNVLGMPFKIYGNYKRNKKFTDALNNMNSRFDELDELINNRFDEITAFIDRKQFETDIIDPSNILWGQLMAYIQHPGNITHDIMLVQCVNQKAWQIATKIRERLYGPDNSLMTQTASDQYKNSTFMNFKEVIMYRTFQMVLVQSFCVGLQNGPNYNQTGDWTWQRMYKIYTDVVSNIIQQRQIQEKEYFAAVLPRIVQSNVPDKKAKNFWDYANTIRNILASNYQWDKFGVVVAEKNCWQSEVVVDRQFSTEGGIPWALWITNEHYTGSNADVYVFRYWGDDWNGSRQAQFEYCMKSAHHDNLQKWADSIYCGQDIVMIRSSWFCGGNTQFAGIDSQNYVNRAEYKEGLAVAPYALKSRPGNITNDLGFWERTIDVQLIPA